LQHPGFTRNPSFDVKRFVCCESWRVAIDDTCASGSLAAGNGCIRSPIASECIASKATLRASDGWVILGKLDRGCAKLNACFT
jgi:hypothetical protein